jgi:NADH dehydrogenase
MYKGVAQMFGKIKVRGFLAWVLHRTYHVFAMPTFNRKLRIAAGWTGSVLLRREVVALGSLHDPRAEFRAASVPPKPKGQPVTAEPAVADSSLPPLKAEKDSPAERGDAHAS